MYQALVTRALLAAVPCLVMAQTGILQVKVVEGERGVHRPGARVARPLTISVTDEAGRPVPEAAVSFHLAETGPGGTFPNGLRTDLVLTGADGRATLRTLQLNRTPGPFRIRITVVKDQVRAGIVSQQYIAGIDHVPGTDRVPGNGRAAAGDPRAEAEPSPAPTRSAAGVVIRDPRSQGRSFSRKWLYVAAAAGVAAVAGIKVAGGSSSTPSGNPTAGAVTAPSAPVLGVPIITIGKP